MKKSILTLFVAVAILFTQAQPVPNASFTDCNGNTKTIYQTLASGKVLVVANAGTNCSICMSHAPGIGTYATNNTATIEVWGSITTKTGGNPGCGALNNWVNTYGWSNVFTFLDSNKYWFQTATPRYFVIDPSDSTQAYAGTDLSAAKQVADALAASNIGLEEVEIVTSVFIAPTSINLELSSFANNGQVELFDITGKKLAHWTIDQGSKSVQLPFVKQVKSGIYLLKMNINGKQLVKKLML